MLFFLSSAKQRASGRHARSNPPALLPLAPRPTSSSPPSATQSSSRSGYGSGRGSQPPGSTASTPRSKAAVAAGGRGAPQGAPHHRTHSHSHSHSQNPSSPRSGSASMRYSQQQQYSPQHQAAPAHYGGLSPLSMPLGSFSPSLCSVSDIPASMSMVSPFDHTYGDPSLLDGGAAAFPSLEDFDLGGLPDELMQEDWRWFADDNELR